MPQEPQTHPMVTLEADEVSNWDISDVNPPSPSPGQPPSVEERGRSRRDERSRSRERTPPPSQDADESSAAVDPQNRVSDRSRSPQEQEGSRRQGPQQQRERKLLLRCNRVNHRRPRSTSLLIQMKMMKNLEMSLEPLQKLNLPYQYFLTTLVMKTVSTATNIVHKVGTPIGPCPTQISTF